MFVSVYNNAKVNVKQSDSAKAYVYKKSSDCMINANGEVMEGQKQLILVLFILSMKY